MKTMKTIKDIEDMKNTPNNIFGTAYKFLIEDLHNNEVSKTNGSIRNERILEDYDEESKAIILKDLKTYREAVKKDNEKMRRRMSLN